MACSYLHAVQDQGLTLMPCESYCHAVQDRVTDSDAMLVTVFNMTQRKALEAQLQDQQVTLQQ